MAMDGDVHTLPLDAAQWSGVHPVQSASSTIGFKSLEPSLTLRKRMGRGRGGWVDPGRGGWGFSFEISNMAGSHCRIRGGKRIDPCVCTCEIHVSPMIALSHWQLCMSCDRAAQPTCFLAVPTKNLGPNAISAGAQSKDSAEIVACSTDIALPPHTSLPMPLFTSPPHSQQLLPSPSAMQNIIPPRSGCCRAHSLFYSLLIKCVQKLCCLLRVPALCRLVQRRVNRHSPSPPRPRPSQNSQPPTGQNR